MTKTKTDEIRTKKSIPYNLTELALIYDEMITGKVRYNRDISSDRANARTNFLKKALSKEILDKALERYFEEIRTKIYGRVSKNLERYKGN